MSADQPNVLFVMTDQQRFDAIGALGNDYIYTPNLDRLVESGVSFTNAYSQCPVCVPARYNLRTGREPLTNGYYANAIEPTVRDDQQVDNEERCGPYLPRRMSELGYRTFGIGKFHTFPRFEDLGYDVHLHSEEIYETDEHRERDAYASFIDEKHPEFGFIEQLHGERTEMYYMPQSSPLPAELTVESWAADRAVEQIAADDERPFFGLVSFIGPHPPLAPPVPYNRMYDPDQLEGPARGNIEIDHMDEQLPWMNHLIWASDDGDHVDDLRVRTLKARYYGEITYIDRQVGKLLDSLEDEGIREDTLVVFVSDHGEHMGDHYAWQKESFFEASARIPFLVSWPDRLSADECCDELVCLTDLFGVATAAAGQLEPRDGIDVLGMLEGTTAPREQLFGYYEEPGSRQFKLMVREGDWKYVFMANGGREQLFDVAADPHEFEQRLEEDSAVAERLRQRAVQKLTQEGLDDAVDGSDLRRFEFEARPRRRVHQFGSVADEFPEHPSDLIEDG